MAKEIFKLIDCPENSENCVGLFVLAGPGGIEKEQNSDGYIVRAENESGLCERYGNCGHYDKCYINAIKQSLKKSREIMTPDFATEAYN